MNRLFPDPQYLIVNKVPSGGERGSKFFWNPKNVKSIRAKAIDEIREVVKTNGSPTRKLGFCFVIPYLEKNVDSILVLKKILSISLHKEIPVLVKLEGNLIRNGVLISKKAQAPVLFNWAMHL